MADYTVVIDMDAKCAECRKGGAVPNGLCLKCTTKAVYSDKPLKSLQARAVRRRGKEQQAKRNV